MKRPILYIRSDEKPVENFEPVASIRLLKLLSGIERQLIELHS
jgi:hypothetical protein